MKKKYVWVCVVILIVLNVFLIGCGIKNDEGFFGVNIINVISLDVSVVLSIYVVQSLVSKRRGYDFMAKMLDSIIEDLGKPELLDHSRNVEAQLLQRYISNRLRYIEKACPKDVKSDMKYIRNEYESIQNFYGDHVDAEIDDAYYKREKTNIVTKVAKVQLALYGFDVSNQNDESST